MLMLFTTQVIYQFIELFRSGAMSSVAALLFGCAGLGTMGYLAMTLIRTKPLKTLTTLKSGDPI